MTDSHPPNSSLLGGHRTLVETFPNGVLVLFDVDLRYRIVGPTTLPFSQRNAADMVGKTIDELFPAEAARELAPKLRATLNGETRSFDMDYGDEIHHIETHPTSIDGQPYGVLVTQAVTEQRQMATELEQKSERLAEFSSMVSHDLRNPLNVAQGRLNLYRETGDETHLNDVDAALNRIHELTTSLLTLAQHGAPTDIIEPVTLESVAEDAWTMVETKSGTLETEPGTVQGDKGQLQGLFENLIRNAIGHGGPDVTVRVGPLDNGFYVEDTGTGIPPEEREQVFEHGFSTGYGGSGVGLAIVRRIADAHGFDISVRASAEGGARFEFTLTNQS